MSAAAVQTRCRIRPAWVALLGLAVVCAALSSAACRRSGGASEGAARSASSAAAAPAPRAAVVAESGNRAAGGGIKHVPACDLITRDEMSAMLAAPIGKPFAENADATTSCTYPPGEAGSSAQAEVAIEWTHTGGASFERQLVDAFGSSAVGRQVAHHVELGDDASYSREGVLSIRAGATQITITLPMRPGSEEKATAIGHKLLDRLGIAATPAAAKAAATAPVETAPAKPDEPSSIVGDLLKMFGGGPEKTVASTKEPAASTTSPDAASGIPLPEELALGAECPDPGPDAGADMVLQAAALVPLKKGLTLSSTWTGGAGDYEHECLVQVNAVTASAVDVSQSCPIGPDHHLLINTRRVCRSDLRNAHIYLTSWIKLLPDVIGGTTMFSLSRRSFGELTSGASARHRYVEFGYRWKGVARPLIEDAKGALVLLEDTDGALVAGRSDRQPYRVIVNDRVVELPAIVGRSDVNGPKETTATVLEDERFPLMLDYEVPKDHFSIRYTKISYPTGGDLEKHLAVEKRVDVYGIYFDFDSDRLRAESEPVLSEIGDALTKHADWTLTINGHTDNVGGEAFNLALSRRRSEAVRRALAERYHIDAARLTTAGLGASEPKESNATIEGRAKNRRVELIRR
jgi:flagellar motor protein MotB